MHTPEEHSDLLLRRLGKTQIPQQQFPVKRGSFTPERRPKDRAIWFVTRGHKAPQVMTGNQFMMNSGACKIDIVAAHAHHLLFVGHRVGGEGNQNHFSAQKERTDKLSLRRHHLDSPRLFCEFRNGDEVVVFDKLDRFEREIANHLWLLAGFDVKIFDVFERFVPIIAVAQLARSLFHLVLTPGHLFFTDHDDFFRRVRDHLRAEFTQERFASDRIADDVTRITRSRIATAGTLKVSATTAWSTTLAGLLLRAAFGPDADSALAEARRLVRQRLIEGPVRLFIPP